MIEDTIESLRSLVATNHMLKRAETICRNALYEFLIQQQSTVYNNPSLSTALAITDLELWEHRHTIHFGTDTPYRFDVVFNSFLAKTSAFVDDCAYSGDKPPWPDTVSCELTSSFQIIKVEIGVEDEGVLFCKNYQYSNEFSQVWKVLFCCLEKQIKNTTLLTKSYNACLQCITPSDVSFVSEAKLVHSECSLTLNRDWFENGYFVMSWDVFSPSDKLIGEYLYWVDPSGTFLKESYNGWV